jgi:hypothetical protein
MKAIVLAGDIEIRLYPIFQNIKHLMQLSGVIANREKLNRSSFEKLFTSCTSSTKGFIGTA